MYFAFIFSECITNASSKEGLKVCECNFFQRKVVLLEFYLFNYDASKSTIFMLSMAFEVLLSAVFVKLGSFVSCDIKLFALCFHMYFFYLKLIILFYGDKNFLLYRQIFLREENFAVSRFFAKSRNLIPVNIKIFCQPRNFISRISKIFWPTAKFISTKFNHENLENLMNGIPTKLYESKKVEQIEVKLTCYHETNLSKMASWFLKSHDHTRRGTTYFKWLERCRDRKCTENGETCLEPNTLIH